MAIVLFDGVCNLCQGVVRFIIERDPHERFHFAPLGSTAASEALQHSAFQGPLGDTVVLVRDGRVFLRSDAVLEIARGLTFPWPLAYALTVIPRPLRDWVYNVVAHHRYRWFGRQERCLVPTADLRRRFLG